MGAGGGGAPPRRRGGGGAGAGGRGGGGGGSRGVSPSLHQHMPSRTRDAAAWHSLAASVSARASMRAPQLPRGHDQQHHLSKAVPSRPHVL